MELPFAVDYGTAPAPTVTPRPAALSGNAPLAGDDHDDDASFVATSSQGSDGGGGDSGFLRQSAAAVAGSIDLYRPIPRLVPVTATSAAARTLPAAAARYAPPLDAYARPVDPRDGRAAAAIEEEGLAEVL